MNIIETNQRGRGRPGIRPPEVCPHCLQPIDPKKMPRPDIVVGDVVVSVARQEVTWKGTHVKVTKIECAILALLTARPGVTRARADILEVCWGYESESELRTIDTHVKRLRRRFETIDPEFSMIESVYGTGYRWRRQ